MFAGDFALEVEDRVLAKHVVIRRISAASCSQSFSPGRTVAVTLQITALQVTLPMPRAQHKDQLLLLLCLHLLTGTWQAAAHYKLLVLPKC